ncbi:MAG: T9SS type A sorting domain-containing protein, partial [Ignavibacteria bacterium]|nr:T9SS type A sorting domain-containing protein [Ignavibacteria bacterium]
IKSGHYKIEVFDMLGRSVAILFNEFKNAGSYNLNYDASNLSSGIYFYKLNSPELNIIKKFILVK